MKEKNKKKLNNKFNLDFQISLETINEEHFVD